MQMETSTTTKEIKQENSYTIISDKNHSFNITFQNLNSNIGISAIYEEDIMKHYYEKKFNFNELKQNKYLGLCNSIDEVYQLLIMLLKKNQTKIIEKKNNEIHISIPVEHVNITEILFVVNEIRNNDNEKSNELFSIIKQEIKNFKEKIKKINKLKEENKIIKEENNNLKLEIKNNKEKNTNEITNLKLEINKLREENKITKEENNNLRIEIKNIILKNTNEITNLRLEFNNLKEENKSMKNENNNLIEVTKTIKENYLKEITNLQLEIKKFKEEINKNIINKSLKLENQINFLNGEIINKKINNQNQIPMPKKEEIKKFYECNFVEGNYTLNTSKYELMKKNYIFNYEISLINRGNLPWPINTYIDGKSNDGLLECKPIILNKNKEIMPKEKIVIKISIDMRNIKDENYENILPLKLSFQDKSIPIKQNGFNLIVKVKKIIKNLISNDMFEKIKNKLEEDYSLFNSGWTDEVLMEKINNNLDVDLINAIGKDDEYVIDKINELIGEELLEI